jgi:HlyD family secretion protein
VSADAAVQSAQANIDRLEAAQVDAQKNYNRTKQLVDAGVAANMTLETAQSTLSQAAAQKQQAVAQLNPAKAQLQASNSQVNQARAQVAQAKASVDAAQVNLDHTIIRAPIDGVVVSRSVDVGQTVAASLQAPVIFMIANDLTRMQVLANIDEADVGQLANDSAVTFTVDSYPNDTFRGRVSQIRLAPQTVQNVVTYTAVIDVANPDMKLKPGMTANVTAEVARRDNVLAVPAGALRFKPEGAAATPAAGNKRWSGSVLWKVEGEKLTPVQVRLGLTDGVQTEILSGEVKEGDTVAVPQATGSASQAGRAPAGRSMFPMGGRGGGRK